MPLIMTDTRLCIDDTREMWSKPIDLFLLLSLPILNVPLAANDDDVDSARYAMVAQCGAGGKPKLALILTHMRLKYRCDDGLSRLIYFFYYPNQS